jgi:vacuolar protein sorting-associated protein 29
LKTIATDIHAVRGDHDEPMKSDSATTAATVPKDSAHAFYAGAGANTDLPEVDTFTLGQFRFGLIHGHQVVPMGDANALATLARKLDVDVLVSGSTHDVSCVDKDGVFYVNPGSATGAFCTTDITADKTSTVPSFVLMDIQGSSIVAYCYALEKGDVKFKKREFKKQRQ